MADIENVHITSTDILNEYYESLEEKYAIAKELGEIIAQICLDGTEIPIDGWKNMKIGRAHV